MTDRRRRSLQVLRSPVLALTILGVIGLWAVTLAGRSLLAPPAWVGLAVVVLPYLYLVASCWCGILVLRRRWRRTALLLLAGLLLAAFLQWGGGWLTSGAEGAGQSITIMSWNVHRPGDWGRDREAQLACVAGAIRAASPAVLSLQEVSRKALRDLQERLQMSCKWIDYHGARDPAAGGLAACVPEAGAWRISLRHDLSLPPGWKYVYIELKHPEGERFNVLTLHVVPPHLGQAPAADMDAAYRSFTAAFDLQGQQADKVLAVVEGFRDPTIIAGDFNSTRDAALHVRFRDSLVDTWQQAGNGFGATRIWNDWLPLRIDFVYASQAFSVVGARVGSASCSDHYPVISTLALD